uniref:Putative secreted protein n=1 Tax=Xenopsylla cheopis TaxID=163159 RepID=A0A6M2DZE2_XENCH
MAKFELVVLLTLIISVTGLLNADKNVESLTKVAMEPLEEKFADNNPIFNCRTVTGFFCKRFEQLLRH